MATPDFSKIWASSSPLPAYTFSDEDYVTGWDFVGSAPPTKNEFDAWFQLVDTKLKWLYDQMQATASKLYPVGSVYISFEATDPSTLFGGTWVRLKDRFLLASGDTYAPNTTGGSATKTIATNNLPSHTHSCNTIADHTHNKGSMNITGYFDVGDVDSSYRGGAFTFSTHPTTWNQRQAGGEQNYAVHFNAKNSWTGVTSANGGHTHTIGNTGGGLPLNIMPPYQTVYMWRRTA